MRRPLFIICLCFVFLLGLWIVAGRLFQSRTLLPEVNGRQLVKGDRLVAWGKVYRKESRLSFGQEKLLIYIKSVSILSRQVSDSDDTSGGEGESIQETPIPVTFNLICELPGDAALPLLGSSICLEGEFAPFSEAANPGQFDSREYYHALGIGGTMKKSKLTSGGQEGSRFLEGLYGLRCMWKERLYRIFPEAEASVMATMLLGEKGALDSGIRELYMRNGIVHILSISGLHITMIGMGFYKILRKLGIRKQICTAAGCILLVCYGMLTGMGVSAVRAIGMYIVRMAGESIGRTYDMLTALGVMAVFILAGSPGYLTHSGFLLSFGSVLGIGAFLPVLRHSADADRVKDKPEQTILIRQAAKLWDGLLQSMTGSLSITLFTLPIQLAIYSEVPVYSVFLNMLVLPFMGIVMGTGILVMVIPGISIAGVIPQAVLKGYEWLCRIFELLPGHIWSPGCPRAWQIAIFYAGLFILIIAGKKWRFRGKYLVLAALVILLGYRDHSGLEVFFLDVGQGDCIIVRTNGGDSFLFDGGSSSSGSPGKNIIIPFLKYQGIRKLTVVISHPDSDHINGILELLEEGKDKGIQIQRIMLPAIEKESRNAQFGQILGKAGSEEIIYMGLGDMWESGGASFRCLHPAKGNTIKDSNAYSLCIRMEYGSFSMLLTGDVEGEGEEELLKVLDNMEDTAVTVLKVAHHGSRNSTASRLLELLKPDIAVISCGSDNSYGHPHKELLERLEDSGAAVLKTPDTGAVALKVRKNRLKVKSYRNGEQ